MQVCHTARLIRQFVLLLMLLFPLEGWTIPPPEVSPHLAGALKEKELVVYSAVAGQAGEKLATDFSALYPGIRVQLVNLTGAEVFNRHMSDIGRRRPVADLLWSSEIELQAALVKEGYAAAYHAGGSSALFPWANQQDLAYATAHEPVAMVYNRKLLAEKDVPRSHRELQKAAGDARFKGKIATCDPERNNRAFFFLVHDQMGDYRFWSMVSAFGASGLQLYPDYGALLDKVASGEALLGYNVPAGEALRRAGADPSVGVLYLADYTLSTPQTILMAKDAPHPNAARLWVDYLLSLRGQEIITREGNLLPVRQGVGGGGIAASPQKLPVGKGLRVMMPAGGITRFLEKGIRRGFLLRWKQMLGQAK